MFFLFFLFCIWGGWSSRITGNTQTWKILNSNTTGGVGQDGSGDPYYEAPGNFRVGHVECVFLAVSYPVFFLCISKVSSMLHLGSVGWFHNKQCYLNSVYPSFFMLGGGGWTSNLIFKEGGLAGSQILEGLLGKRGWLFSGGCSFRKNRSKPVIFNDKKSL